MPCIQSGHCVQHSHAAQQLRNQGAWAWQRVLKPDHSPWPSAAALGAALRHQTPDQLYPRPQGSVSPSLISCTPHSWNTAATVGTHTHTHWNTSAGTRQPQSEHISHNRWTSDQECNRWTLDQEYDRWTKIATVEPRVQPLDLGPSVQPQSLFQGLRIAWCESIRQAS